MEGQEAGVTSSRWLCQITAGCVAAATSMRPLSLPSPYMVVPVMLLLAPASAGAAGAAAATAPKLWALPDTGSLSTLQCLGCLPLTHA